MIAGRDHSFERATLVGHVALGGFHQIRDQVVSPFELHLDLRERVLVAVLERDKLVVDARAPQHGDERATYQHSEHNESGCRHRKLLEDEAVFKTAG